MSRYNKGIIASVYGLLQIVNVLAATGVSGQWVTLGIAALTAASVVLIPNAATPAPPGPGPVAVAGDVGQVLGELVALLDHRYTPPPAPPTAPTPEGLTVVTRPKE